MPDDDAIVASNEDAPVSAESTDNETPTIDELLAENRQLRENEVKLAQQLNSANGRVKQQNLTFAAVEEMEERTTSLLERSMTAILNEDDPDERRRKIGEAFAEQRERQQFAKRVNQLQPVLLRTARRAGLDFDTSPELADARKHWENGELDEAMNAVSEAALGVALERKPDGVFTKEEVDQALAAAERNAGSTARRNVDTETGEPPKPPPDTGPITREQFGQALIDYKATHGGRPMPAAEMHKMHARIRRG